MAIFIALLRGVNVSGKNRLKMDALKIALQQCGYPLIETYIQSGNLLTKTNRTQLQFEKDVHRLLQHQFNISTQLFVYSLSQWQKIIENDPFKTIGGTPYLCFLEAVPAKIDVEKLDPLCGLNDRYALIEATLYLFPSGAFSDSKLNNNVIERKLKMMATTRNYKTVITLLALAINLEKKHSVNK